jgi:hypothetical protein
MPKTKLFLESTDRNIQTIQRWANIVEDKLEVGSLDEPKTMYIAIRTSTTPKQIVLFEKRGDVDVEVGTINIA